MARRSKGPAYEGSKGRYVANLNSKKIILLEGVPPEARTEETNAHAQEMYDQIVKTFAAQTEGDRGPTYAILNAYLLDARTRTIPRPMAPKTYYRESAALKDFASLYGDLPWNELKVSTHVNEWLATRKAEAKVCSNGKRYRPWSNTTAVMNLNSLKAACKWAAGVGGLVKSNPFDAVKGIRQPTQEMGLKHLAIEEDEHQALYDQANLRRHKHFAYFLQLLYHTGARPAEIYLARAHEWNRELNAIVIDPKDPRTIGRLKNRRHLLAKGRKRTVYVPARLAPLIEELIALYPQEKDAVLFRTEEGRIWTDNTIANRFRALIRSVNSGSNRSVNREVRKGLVLYSYRHGFVTRALSRPGADPAKLCEALDTSMLMLHRHYSHLFERHDVLRDFIEGVASPSVEKRPGHHQDGGSSSPSSAAS